MIQTHECNQRLKNSDCKINLFKKETNLIPEIIPLVTFTKYLFYLHLPITTKIQKLSKTKKSTPKLPPHVQCTRIFKTNINILSDFIDNIYSIYTFSAISDIGNIVTLINNHEIYAYCLGKGKHILCYYFFKNSQLLYENIGNNNALEFIGSYNNTKSIDLFYSGFMYSINLIQKEKLFTVLLYENISHNVFLFNKIIENNSIVLQNECAYYLYNYIIPSTPIIQKDCFFLF